MPSPSQQQQDLDALTLSTTTRPRCPHPLNNNKTSMPSLSQQQQDLDALTLSTTSHLQYFEYFIWNEHQNLITITQEHSGL